MSNFGSQCIHCGARMQPNSTFCVMCGKPQAPPSPVANQPQMGGSGGLPPFVTPQPPPPPPVQTPLSRTQKMHKRYTDGYRVARFVTTIGTLLKILGFVLGILLFLLSVAVAAEQGKKNGGGEIFVMLGVFFGFIIWAILWISGVILSSLGQITKAQIDCAVHSSPFITDEERASIMSI